MTEKQMVEYLHRYITDEMNLLEESKMSDYDHEFSKAFCKRMKRMFWSEKYFGSNLHLGYAVRRIAIVVIIVASLFSANQVSAKVFGFDIWKYVVSFLSENKMEEKTYIKKKVSSQDERIEVRKDEPENIPVQFKETARLEDADNLYVEWNYEKKYLQYNRIVLSEGVSIATDAEYDYKEKINISGYGCEYYIKGEEAWIIWDDRNYRYQIIATNIKDAKELLMKVAEDIYQ